MKGPAAAGEWKSPDPGAGLDFDWHWMWMNWQYTDEVAAILKIATVNQATEVLWDLRTQWHESEQIWSKD